MRASNPIRRRRGVRGTEGRDAEGVEGMGNGDGISPSPADKGVCGSVVRSPAGSGAGPRRITVLLLSTRDRTPLVAMFVEN